MEDFNQIEPLVLHYLQGNITEEEMRRLHIWLSEKEDNKQLLFQLKHVYDMRKGGLYPNNNEIQKSWQRLSDKIRTGRPERKDRQQPSVAGRRRLLIGFYKYAAVAAIFIFLTLGIQKLLTKEQPVSYTEMDVAAGPRMSHLTLSDGTKVVLNASTKFRYPDKFNGKLREVFLDGEAFFEVSHNDKKPFIIRTERQKISVLGTSFNVMDYSTDDFAITTLMSGSVKIQSINPYGEPGKEHLLRPNQQAYINKVNSEILLTNVKIDTERTWVNKVYHFRDEPLLQITRRLEKIYGMRINIVNETLKSEKCTGTFPMNLEIEDVLDIINFDNQFSYKVENDSIVIW